MPPDFEPVLQTPRLLLRTLDVSDASDFFALNSDPEVLKFTGDEPFESVAAATCFLQNYQPYSEYGYGRWAVILKETGVFAGWCGLKYHPGSDETDIGYRFFRRYWNLGFATEAARACVEYGFQTLGLSIIVGRVLAGNRASIRVLEKIGLEFWKTAGFHGQPGLIYKIERPQIHS